MNVYVRELAAALAQSGVDVRVYVRRTSPDPPDEVRVEPGLTVVHLEAGSFDLAKESLPDVCSSFGHALEADLRRQGGADLLHANYWLSGVAAHEVKHRLGVPLVSTFHTLARVKATWGDPEPISRSAAEARIIGCSDVVCASCPEEAEQLISLCGADPERIEIVPPGVISAFFSPGSRSGARAAVGLDDRPTLLFVGRIQALKGLDVAVGALAALNRSDARLVIIGGPSGAEGDRELQRVLTLAHGLGVAGQLQFVEPQPHHLLASWYRAADVCVVPSRSESFGLVALEAMACGVPVVATRVGGLRDLVTDGLSGVLVDERSPEGFARAIEPLLESTERAASMGRAGALLARDYTWMSAAQCIGGLATVLGSRRPVECAA